MSRDLSIVVTTPDQTNYLSPTSHHHSYEGSRRNTADSTEMKEIIVSSRRHSALITMSHNHRPSQLIAQRRLMMELLQTATGIAGSSKSLNNPMSTIKENKLATKSITKNRRVGNDDLFTALSALYAKLIVVLGIAFPVTDVISHRAPPSFYQGFYLLLYLISVCFVIFMYAAHLKTRAVFTLIDTFEQKHGDQIGIKKGIARYGSFYLRVGSIAFGIGSMVYSGLEFGQYFELKEDDACQNILVALNPCARMLLSMVQMQFIFLNTKQFEMNQHKAICRFGLMHLVATNLCEWLYVLVEETKHEIYHLSHENDFNHFNLENNLISNETHHLHKRATAVEIVIECRRTNIMGSLVQQASPFLFPCTIEYSLICAVILFEMWKKIKNENDPQSRKSSKDAHHLNKNVHHLSVDCSKAHRGMFSGILVIVLTIISLIMYFVLKHEVLYKSKAVLEVSVTEVILYMLTILAVVAAMYKMRDLKFSKRTYTISKIVLSLSGVNSDWLDLVLNKSSSSAASHYHGSLIEKLMNIIHTSSQPSCRVRLVTIELTLKLLSQLLGLDETKNSVKIPEAHKNSLLAARNQSMTVLKSFYKSEDIFLDLFEDEYNEMVKSVLNVEFLCMDSTILLPPTTTPLTGIGFTRRLPCGEVEKARRAIRVFFQIRKICQSVNGESENLLPLSNPNNCVQVENALDLNNSDLIACTVIMKDGTKFRRFLVIDILQLILVEPDPRRLGWGVAKLVGFLQDVEVIGDKDDSRCLHVTIHRGATANRNPILSAKFVFDDHIRSMAAKQRLTKGRTKARQKKMYQIAQLLEIPQLNESPTPMYTAMLKDSRSSRAQREHRPLFSTNRIPGVAAALRRESMPTSGSVSRMQMINRGSIDGESSSSSSGGSHKKRSSSSRKESAPINTPTSGKSREGSKSRSGTPRSRENSPRLRPRSEEIPLEDLKNSSPSSRNSSNAPSRSMTPSRLGTDSSNGISQLTLHPSTSNVVQMNSIETSFIGNENERRKRGGIEHV